MARTRAAALVLVLATTTALSACAPGPTIETAPTSDTAPTAPTPTPSPSAPGPTPPPSTLPPDTGPDAPPELAPLDLFPVAPEDLPPLDPVAGTIAFHGADAAIRRGATTTALDVGTLPAQPTWSRGGERLALVSLEGRDPFVGVYDGATGELLAEHPAPRRHFFATWNHDATLLAALGPGTDDNGTTRTVLDILDAEGAPLHTDVVTADSLYLSWDPASSRLAVHADDRLLRVDGDGMVTDLGAVGLDFSAPKWIPGADEVLLVADIEGGSFFVRRGLDGGDTLRKLGPAEPEVGIAVSPTGEVAAISRSFDVEGDPTAERIGLGPLAQTGDGRSGSVELLDLETGDREEIFQGHAAWTEWNPSGSRLLLHEGDGSGETGTWWVHDTTADPANALVEVVTATPTPLFARTYLPFGDQFVEAPRLWAPDGEHFVYTELAEVGSLVRTARADGVGEPATVGAGEVGFWSPLD